MQSPPRDLSVSPVLQALRAGTSELHIALEKRLPFFSDTLDQTAFLHLMQAYYGFYSSLEQALLDCDSVVADFDLRSLLKSPTLRGDLLALGMSNEALALLPRCQQLPEIDSLPAFLGVMYVLEGATLGCNWTPLMAQRFSIFTAPTPDAAGGSFSIMQAASR